MRSAWDQQSLLHKVVIASMFFLGVGGMILYVAAGSWVEALRPLLLVTLLVWTFGPIDRLRGLVAEHISRAQAVAIVLGLAAGYGGWQIVFDPSGLPVTGVLVALGMALFWYIIRTEGWSNRSGD